MACCWLVKDIIAQLWSQLTCWPFVMSWDGCRKPSKPRKKAKVRKWTKKDVKMVFSELKESLTGIDQCWCLTHPEAHYSDCLRCSATCCPFSGYTEGDVTCLGSQCTLRDIKECSQYDMLYVSFSKTMFNTAPSHKHLLNPHHTAVWKYNCVLGPLVMSGHSANSVGSKFASLWYESGSAIFIFWCQYM